MNSEHPARQSRPRSVRIAVASLAAFLATLSDAVADEVCTSFEAQPEGICQNETVFPTMPLGDFTIGTSPITATFTGGNVMIVGIPAHKLSGTHTPGILDQASRQPSVSRLLPAQ